MRGARCHDSTLERLARTTLTHEPDKEETARPTERWEHGNEGTLGHPESQQQEAEDLAADGGIYDGWVTEETEFETRQLDRFWDELSLTDEEEAA